MVQEGDGQILVELNEWQRLAGLTHRPFRFSISPSPAAAFPAAS